jgi:2,3-dihydroxyphenylpropionate 1,2-dioxygenase
VPEINSDFDEKFLQLINDLDVSTLLDLTSDELQAQIGNGGQEIRTWIAMVAALKSGQTPMQGRKLAYAPIDRWLTGMGVSLCLPIEEPVR